MTHGHLPEAIVRNQLQLIRALLNGVSSDMSTVVESVLQRLFELNEAVEASSKNALASFEEKFLDPDRQTLEMIVATQNRVDEIIEKAEEEEDTESASELVLRRAQAVRLRSRFQREIESPERATKILANQTLAIVAGLSATDMLLQRIEHVELFMKTLKALLPKVKAGKLEEAEKEIEKSIAKLFTQAAERQLIRQHNQVVTKKIA